MEKNPVTTNVGATLSVRFTEKSLILMIKSLQSCTSNKRSTSSVVQATETRADEFAHKHRQQIKVAHKQGL